MAMRSGKVGLSVFVCLLAIFSTSLGSSLPMVFAESRVLAQTVDARKAEADRLFNQGIQQYQTSQSTAALQSWEQALKIYREIKDREGEGKALGNLGIAYASLGDYPKAIDYYQQTLAIAREIKDPQSQGAALGNLGLAHRNLGNYPKAIEYHQQSLAILREIKNPQGEGKELVNLGLVYFYQGNYPKAIEYQEQGLAIAREIKDPNIQGNALGNLGNAYRELGDYPKAIDCHQQSLAILREIKNRRGEGYALGSLGLTYHDLGDYPKAIDYLQQGLVISQKIKDLNGQGAALGNLGNAYLNLGDYPKAIDYHQQSLATLRKIQDLNGQGAALGNLGLAYYFLRDYFKAIEYHQQSLAISRKIQDPQGEGNALGNLGIAYGSLGDYPKAIEYHQQSLAISRKIQDPQGEANSLNDFGVTYYKQGNLALAESTLIEGIKVYESLRGRKSKDTEELKDTEKVSIFETQRGAYQTLQQVLIAQNKTDAALEIAERGRGRAFVELLASRLSASSKEEPPKPPKIGEIKQIAKSQNATLVQYSIISDDFKTGGKQQWKESELYIWVIKPTGEVTFRKANLKPLWQKENTNLEELVKISRQSIGVRGAKMENPPPPNPETQKKRLQKLHEILISPIADLLPKKETDKVVFIPQSSLFLVPFPALQDKNGKYLIEKHTILTSPSIQVLDLTKKRYQKLVNQPLQTNNMLIVGNPIMPKVTIKIGDKQQKLSPLPEAEKEAKAIANLFKIQPLIGKQATESTVVQRLPQAGIIHFATHGLFDDIRGLDSSIALTPENPNSLSSPLSKEEQKRDGLLTAEEIFGLELKANLVVLSACDTGRGKITGDGVIGLSRSFISAGVPSVIVSLWSVDDGSTAFLMTEFYQNLQQKMDKATALRKAMLETKKKYSSPSQWAAFTLIGESE
jgi:CHAT domain-containing protein/lipopolysaccharide biosynthesis regulator YciM